MALGGRAGARLTRQAGVRGQPLDADTPDPRRPRPQNCFIYALTYQGHLVCVARAQSAIWSSDGRQRASTAITLSSQ
jgi:hypothetical protein